MTTTDHRPRRTCSQPIAGAYFEGLIGVDRYGALIAHDGARLLRWSELGGWRVLWSPE